MALAFLLTAFFVDISRSLQAHGDSLEVASQAARAAADQVTQESLRSGDPAQVRIDPAAARTAGQDWLTQAGATGQVDVEAGNTVVTVTARVPCRATLLAVLGYGDLSRPATASATLLYGTPGSDGQPIATGALPRASAPAGARS
ncbi:hypothetical protein [Kineosporia babensis]|uniref:Uncharacterized protein n=1 Tax=Kineosporia babensis TaxID=499548 RepID=A0A9X1NNR4_9ACTN|nr:hypothetical protein [Kineosporia babensis]MCD5316849.1 hypothetical protein [Kineosporia babensis]